MKYKKKHPAFVKLIVEISMCSLKSCFVIHFSSLQLIGSDILDIGINIIGIASLKLNNQ